MQTRLHGPLQRLGAQLRVVTPGGSRIRGSSGALVLGYCRQAAYPDCGSLRQRGRFMADQEQVLDGVVAFVHCCQAGGPGDAKAVLKHKLESLGARVCQRVCKDTTHVVFKRYPHATADESQSENALLTDLYEKASKVTLHSP